MFEEPEKRPELFSTSNVVLAVFGHVVFFGFCASVAACSLTPKETVIPMDLTLVVHENLDGNDDEPPPIEKPPETPPPPQPKPKIESPPPPPPQNPPDALEKVSEKKKPEAKKKPEEKKPEKPKMTREERMKAMLERSKVVKPKDPPKPVTNGRTGRKTLSDAEIQKLLSQGYKAGRTEQLADSEEQRCVSLIYRAFYDRWEAPAYSSSLRDIVLTVTFDMNGRVADWRIKSGSGDASADATVKRAAALVKQVYGLSDSFLRANKVVDVRFSVKPQ